MIATPTGPEGLLLVPPLVRQFVTHGILGGYTPLSTFSLQSFNLAFLPQLDTLLTGGALVPAEPVRVRHDRPNSSLPPTDRA